jgi:PPOX class probable F420-dependent enzyme
VSIVVQGDRAYVRTYDKSWKGRRLRNFAEVRFAPSTFRGRPLGREVQARARRLEGEEASAASRLLVRKYPVLHGALVPLSHRLMRTTTLHYELSEVQESQPGSDQASP